MGIHRIKRLLLNGIKAIEGPSNVNLTQTIITEKGRKFNAEIMKIHLSHLAMAGSGVFSYSIKYII